MKERTGKSYVPQIFIGDEHIGSYDEFMQLDARGDIDRRLGREVPEAGEKVQRQEYDLLILGGGPAGLTAAVYAARKNLKVVLISDQLGGQPMLTAEIENYMGYQFITGPELMKKFEDQALRFKIDMAIGDRVTGLEMDGRYKKVTTEGGKAYLGRAAVIATGKKSKKLGIPGESELTGLGVSYCATCDGPLFASKPVVVAGGGNSGMQAALEMAAISPQVHLVSLTQLTGDEVLIGKVLAEEKICKHLLWQPVEAKGNGRVESVTIASTDGKDRKEVEAAALFIEVGLQPNSSFAVDLLELNRHGEIVVDCDGRTGLQGVFAAGDVTQVRDKQIIVAAGEGAKAALSAHEFLMGQR